VESLSKANKEKWHLQLKHSNDSRKQTYADVCHSFMDIFIT